jgi:hypothetical protein
MHPLNRMTAMVGLSAQYGNIVTSDSIQLRQRKEKQIVRHVG